ncbi:exopolysaccharide Pel transporter PelG [Aneurinibacillus sp. REN35]|uniref:exopolysaccharide Pel transporter PelG n=1 Tax=Aneurinibacillus sp. REN35 TaxID=3237286 RepID=UPI003529857C
MAGIGFRLQNLFKEDYFSSRIKAYGYAGLVTAGPWLTVVVSIALLQWLLGRFTFITFAERQLFLLTVSYSFIFSLILTGGLQLVVTRYIADLLYEKQSNDVFSTFLGVTKIVCLLAAVCAFIFLSFSSLPFLYKLVAFCLFISITLIWILMIFLTAAKYYQSIAYAFLGGSLVSVALALWFVRDGLPLSIGEHTQAFGLLSGFSIGMMLTLFALFYALLLTFPARDMKKQFAFLAYFDRYPSLFWTGLLYNLGIWVCNWIIWFGEGAGEDGVFRFHTAYDSAVFWAYITIVPTLTIFVVFIETRFYERYRIFFSYVNNGGTLHQIKQAKASMLQVLRYEMERLLRVQGLFTLFIILVAGYAKPILHVSEEFITLFRFAAIGAFANGILLILLLLLLYFEDRKGAWRSAAFFFACNATLSLMMLPYGYDAYGVSFAFGSTLAFLYAGLRLVQYVSRIDYHAFCSHTHAERNRDLFTRLGNKLDTIQQKRGSRM